VTRQGYYSFSKNETRPYKHAILLAEIKNILEEDEFNDRYGRERFKIALEQKGIVASERTIYRVIQENSLIIKKRKRKSLTKTDKEAYKNDDLLKGDCYADKLGVKDVSDITQIPTRDGKLYISAVFFFYNVKCIGISMGTNMETGLVIKSLKQAKNYMSPNAIFHTDRGSQYTSKDFRKELKKYNIKQSMSHAKTSCYGNARCESIFARFKTEAIYDRYDTIEMSLEEVKSLVFRYFMGYWNNRRISGKKHPKRRKKKMKELIDSGTLVA
jgi:transposase InsO family protein